MREFSKFNIYMTEDQSRQAVQYLDNEDQLIQFFIASYNDYVELHSEANLSVITNPDALFRTKEESDALVYELRLYIRDVVGLPHKEEVKNGNSRSQTTKTTTVKNPR